MDSFSAFWEYIMHLDTHLGALIDKGGIWVYVIMAFMFFAETAFVITVFLPSDSIIFAACALAAVNHSLSFPVMIILSFAAAALGDSVNYMLGKKFRHKINKKQKLLFIKKENLQKADSYFQNHGNITIIISRFVPILRSFAPFTAGITERDYKQFLKFNLIGVGVWSLFFCCLGYFFGNIPFVQKNYASIVFGLGIMSLITAGVAALINYLLSKHKAKAAK